ncbi:MAG TPA: PIN domain-containing protein [Stellaceae bacterium]|jgi:predicted nucleic acid-binding protein|nr:PIN domain-containing protein [Stellaceae bacterium]
MTVLVDTNVLLRQFEPAHIQHRAAVDSVTRLILSREPVHVTGQNIAEFWATATRSPGQNGLGLAVAVAAAAIDHIERVFSFLPDTPAIYDVWKRLVTTHGVIGNQVYDARLVAAMIVHGVGRILTFNVADFTRYGIEILRPSAMS